MADDTAVADAPEAPPAAPADAGAEAPPAEAPEATPAPEAEAEATPEATPEAELAPVVPFVDKSPKTLSKEEAKRGMRESATAREDDYKDGTEQREAGTPYKDKEGKWHDPTTGDYIERPDEGVVKEVAAPAEAVAPAVPETPPDPATPPGPDISPAAETPPVEKPTEAVAEKAPSPFRVEVDADHPVTGMGEAVIDTASEGQARVVRALLNGTYNRRQEVANLEGELAKAEETIARMESATAAQSKWQGTPEYQKAVEEFHNIKESVGDDAASRYWKGQMATLEEMESAEYKTRMASAMVARNKRSGDAWKAQAFQNTQVLPQHIRELPQFKGYFTSALESFDAELKLGHHPDVKNTEQMHTAFRTFFGQRLARQPDVIALMRATAAGKHKAAAAKVVDAETAKKATEAAAAAAVQEFKEEVATKRIDTPPNPLGAIGPGNAPGPEVAPAAPTPEADVPQSAHDIKRANKLAARGDAARHFGAR